ncbi:hypothetical protein DFJ58DRAFT_651721, partial [Suillus subalutaceus]|uniref:uncharacterized protein n=1 Tax=Suillus subalutaceus TaxID=48586 RepID=UPI001B861459
LTEAINIFRESLRLIQHDHPRRHLHLHNLSSAFCSCFMETQKNEDIEEAIQLCQEPLAALPPQHPDRYYDWL